MTVYLMSTTVIPSNAFGRWEMCPISLEDLQVKLYHEGGEGYTSAVGHASTAEAMSELLGYPVVANRVTVEPVPGDVFYCFKLDSRPPEGAILDRAQLEELGYSWCCMRYLG